jgi:hypothetical protein
VVRTAASGVLGPSGVTPIISFTPTVNHWYTIQLMAVCQTVNNFNYSITLSGNFNDGYIRLYAANQSAATLVIASSPDSSFTLPSESYDLNDDWQADIGFNAADSTTSFVLTANNSTNNTTWAATYYIYDYGVKL